MLGPAQPTKPTRPLRLVPHCTARVRKRASWYERTRRPVPARHDVCRHGCGQAARPHTRPAAVRHIPREAEVAQLQDAVALQQDVGRFDVAVHDLCFEEA